MRTSDIEYLILIIVILVLFLCGLKRRLDSSRFSSGIDLETSKAIKGIACVMILMSHYGQRKFSWDMPMGVSRTVWMYASNIALVWFMYFSGLGLSIKSNPLGTEFTTLKHRLKKIYFPCLFVCFISLFCYCIFPDKYSVDDISKLWISPNFHYVHNLTSDNISSVLLFLFGWKDWYVFCIIIFYTFFYLSLFISNRTSVNHSLLLWLCLCFYFIFAYWVFGPSEAHWYRYCWVFFGAHYHAKLGIYSKSEKIIYGALLLILVGTVFLEDSVFRNGYFLAVFLLCCLTLLNRYYTIQSKALMFMAGISYFFYLCHVRIGYFLMTYIEVNSVLFWTLITIIISYFLSISYKKMRMKYTSLYFPRK